MRSNQTAGRAPGPPDGDARPWRLPLGWAAAILIAAGAAAYANSFGGVFLLDDHHTILANRYIRTLLPIDRRMWGTRPVANLTFAINYVLGAARPWGYHALNLAVHLAAALALFGVLRRTLLTDRLRGRFGAAAVPLALTGALLWTLHPLQTSAVTYVTQRFESMMGMFYLLTLYCVIRAAAAKRLGWALAAVAACALGMGSKEVMCTAPLLAMAYDRIFLSRRWGEVLRRRWALYLGLMLTWVILLRPLLHAPPMTPGEGSPVAAAQAPPDSASDAIASRKIYVLTQFPVMLRYLRLSLWPRPLVLDYWWEVSRSFGEVRLAAALVLALLAATAVALWRRPAAGFLGLWFFLILAPTSGVIPITAPIFEHRMYLSLAAVVMLVVGGLYALGAKWIPRGVGVAAVIVAAAGLGTMTFLRNMDYRDRIRMWQDVVDKRPENPRAQNNLGVALLQADRPEEALGHFEAALKLFPTMADAHENKATALSRAGRPEQARQYLAKWLADNPGSARAHHIMGTFLYRRNQLDDAIGHFRRATKLNWNLPEAWSHLGAALAQQKAIDADQRKKKDREALTCLRRAVTLQPHYAHGHYNLGQFHVRRGRRAEARREFLTTVQLDPRHGQAYWHLAHDALLNGRVDEALRYFEAAARWEPRRHTFHADLADVRAQLGLFGHAVEAINRAIDAAAAAGDRHAVRVYTRAREAYRAGRLPPS